MNLKKFFVFLLSVITICIAGLTFTETAHAEEKTYVVGTDITFAPFEFVNSDNEYVGIDIDLLKAIAKDQGFKVIIQPVGFNTALQQVQAGQIDAMIAGMTITDEREKVFDFSTPYFDSGIVMAVAESNDFVTKYADLKGKTVGAKEGTESAEFIEKNKEKYGFKTLLVESADLMYPMLQNGTLDAMFDDYPVVGYAVTQGQPIKMVTEKETGGSYGFAVKKGENAELLKMFNEGLENLKASGDYDKILDTYIGNDSLATKDESTIWGLIKNNYGVLLKGIGQTLFLTFTSFAIAIVIGILIGLMNVSHSKPLRFIAKLYIDLIRGIPMLVLATFIFVALPSLVGLKIPLIPAGIITLSLNAGAYLAETVRGGIEAVPVGQSEAARSLGLPYGRTMQKIILPQAIRIMVPSFINQFVITSKDTTILSAIGVTELLKTSNIIVTRTAQIGKVYLIVAVIYLVIITALTKLSSRVERSVKSNG